MRTLILILATGFLMVSNDLHHQVSYTFNNPQYYCAQLRDGIISITHNENIITNKVVLTNGVIIKEDGTIYKNDGTSFTLKDGECVDQDGNLVKSK